MPSILTITSLTTTDGNGIFRSTDNGDTWILTGLTSYWVLSLAINSSDQIFAGTWETGIFRSTDNGDNWTEINNGLTNLYVVSLAINSTGDIFAGTFGGVFRSTDNGDNWTHIDIGLTDYIPNSLAINSIGHIFVGTDYGGVFRSMDNGDNWTEINTGLTTYNILSLSINLSGHIFAGTRGCGVFRNELVVVTIDIKPGSEPKSINPKIKGVIPVAILTTSADQGEPLNFDATTVDALSVEFGPNGAKECHQEGHIEDVDDDGDLDLVLHFKTRDTGIQCGDTEAGLTAETFGGQSITGSDDIQTVGCGQSKSMIGLGELEDDQGVPASYALCHNYPNPFNPTTTIQYDLPVAGFVTLKVFDVLGREVAVLVQEYLKAGQYKVRFNAEGLPSGVYLYRIQAGDFVNTKRLLLLK